MRLSRLLPSRKDHSFPGGLTDYLVDDLPNIMGKVVNIRTLSRRTLTWGLEPTLRGKPRQLALQLAIQTNPFIESKEVGREHAAALSVDVCDPEVIFQMFLASNHDASRLKSLKLDVYVRQGEREFDSGTYWCLDIANIIVNKKYRSRGLFTSLLGNLEKIPNLAIYVECIQNTRLITFLINRGYQLDNPKSQLPSYYKPPGNLIPSASTRIAYSTSTL